jgi:hypothetical protein
MSREGDRRVRGEDSETGGTQGTGIYFSVSKEGMI